MYNKRAQRNENQILFSGFEKKTNFTYDDRETQNRKVDTY